MEHWLKINQDNPFYLLSIDGGTSTVGVALSHYKDDTLIVEQTWLLKAENKTIKEANYEYLEERLSDTTKRLYSLELQLRDILEHLKRFPLARVVYESHFINPRRPTSVIPLSRFMQVVERILIDYGVMIEYIPPQLMKKAISVEGKLAKADKDTVKKAIGTLIDKGKIVYDGDLNAISEHEIDAIGIIYAYCQQK